LRVDPQRYFMWQALSFRILHTLEFDAPLPFPATLFACLPAKSPPGRALSVGRARRARLSPPLVGRFRRKRRSPLPISRRSRRSLTLYPSFAVRLPQPPPPTRTPARSASAPYLKSEP
jgi:hypothetical protein